MPSKHFEEDSLKLFFIDCKLFIIILRSAISSKGILFLWYWPLTRLKEDCMKIDRTDALSTQEELKTQPEQVKRADNAWYMSSISRAPPSGSL